MTFVTVGNPKQGFRRLLDAVEDLSGKGVSVLAPVFVQAGHNVDFRPMHCEWTSFLSTEEFQRRMALSDLIITHGGAGTLLHALRLSRVPVVMPRRKQYGEHVNDHQMQLVQALASEGRIVPAYEPDDLPTAIAEARRRRIQPAPPAPSRMLTLVTRAIEELITQNR